MSAKISLCMIVGNVDAYIRRCLESFKPVCDELCMVRAIGNLEPDRTIEIAEAWAAKADIPFVFKEYNNAAGHETWDHVDNFAHARQLSFDISTGDYCFWCDSDDVLTSGAESIRNLANAGGYPVFIFPYQIFGRGVTVLRERMMMPTGKWKYPVHEAYQFPIKVEGVRDDNVLITHLPHIDKTGSHERNLRILRSIPESEMTCGLLYHLHGELAGTTEGLEIAKKVLDHPDLGRPERYELFLNLARLAEKPKVKADLLHRAYESDPNRREALGLLACHMMDYGRNVDALTYARQMMATTKPTDESWNDRNAAYEWLGVDIYTQALRVNGHQDEADRLRRIALQKHGGPVISLIHATRGRPEQASRARKLWLDLADNPGAIEHIFVMDSDDEESIPLRRMHHLVVPAGGGCVSAWNNGVMATCGPVVIQMSDDWCPPPRWDALILERMGDLGKQTVLAVSDGARKDDLICMAICTRRYLELDQFMFHPWFTGVFSDNWFTECAYKRGVVKQARDLVFTHNHPAFGKAEVDKTYTDQNAPERYREGVRILNELRQGNDWSTVPGFFNFWAFYTYVANKIQDGDTICEVGVWMGRSIIFLAQLLKRQGKRNVKIIAVDTFKGEPNQPEHAAVVAEHGGSLLQVFIYNIQRCGVEDMIAIDVSTSTSTAAHIADGSLAFCFIDASHDYDSVKADIRAWRGKVKPGGIFAGHDAQYEPVMRAVKEEFPKGVIMLPVWMA